MNTLDIIMLIPCAWFAFKGFSNGLIKELATLAALILGIWLAVHFSFLLESYFENTGEHAGTIAFIVTFLGVIIGVFFLGKLLEKLVTTFIPDIFNKIGGSLFGAFKVVFVFSALFYYIADREIGAFCKETDLVKNSLFYEPVSKVAPVVLPRIEEIRENINVNTP